MPKFKESISEALAEVAALVIGWGFCMAMLAGSFAIGFWLAPHFGGAEHREAFGILSSVVWIWLYEHRRANDRWEHVNLRLTNLAERCNSRDANF